MLGNLIQGVAASSNRLSDTAQNALINIVTIFLGVYRRRHGQRRALPHSPRPSRSSSWACSPSPSARPAASCFGKLMYRLLRRQDQSPHRLGRRLRRADGGPGLPGRRARRTNPANFLLMHAMGPNVAGVIGSAIAAGVLLSTLVKAMGRLPAHRGDELALVDAPMTAHRRDETFRSSPITREAAPLAAASFYLRRTGRPCPAPAAMLVCPHGSPGSSYRRSVHTLGGFHRYEEPSPSRCPRARPGCIWTSWTAASCSIWLPSAPR
ncbi:MAG: sodium ion-translocating decarboxylase subunit beta [Desulfomicrobium escambiense]|nr:sodium ion-translocating decarboxylase subunit beta [Desulfomicrobium escambiense]